MNKRVCVKCFLHVSNYRHRRRMLIDDATSSCHHVDSMDNGKCEIKIKDGNVPEWCPLKNFPVELDICCDNCKYFSCTGKEHGLCVAQNSFFMSHIYCQWFEPKKNLLKKENE